MVDLSKREALIRERINEVGQESFPDDPDVDWAILKMTHHGVFSIVEVEPSPDEVGYSRFEFVLHFPSPDDLGVAGCYCWSHDRWELLFTSSEVPDEWLTIPP